MRPCSLAPSLPTTSRWAAIPPQHRRGSPSPLVGPWPSQLDQQSALAEEQAEEQAAGEGTLPPFRLTTAKYPVLRARPLRERASVAFGGEESTVSAADRLCLEHLGSERGE